MAKVKLLDPADPRRRLDRYELIGEIATGGMATVFLARLGGVGGFQRFVAIKRLHPHLANEQEFVEMFLDEARLAALIHHPHVVPILEVGVTDAGYYIVMEYVEGDTLSKIVARSMSQGKMVPRHILMRALLDTLAGLHAAHELADDRGQLLGLVHRDVSPQNVLIGVDGSSRITDFGVARATARLTSTGSGKLKGKLAYMAPEQTRGDELDRRTDLFAAGIIVWECLAGKRLFKAETEAATLNRILVEPIRPVSDVNADVPKPFDAFILKALDREPVKRFQNAQEMHDALEDAARDAHKNVPGELGIASARDVASYVQAILGQEIGAQRESVRAWLAQSDSGQPKISLPPRQQMRRPRLNSDSDAELSAVPFSREIAFAPTDFSPSPLDSGDQLPATQIEPAVAGGAIAPLADVTMRFALEQNKAKTPAASSSKPGVSAKPSTGGAPRPPLAPPPKPSQPTLLGPGPSKRSVLSLEADADVVIGPDGLATARLGDDGDDAVTVMKPSDAPGKGSEPPRAFVVPNVKTQRGLFASELLAQAKSEIEANGGATPDSSEAIGEVANGANGAAHASNGHAHTNGHANGRANGAIEIPPPPVSVLPSSPVMVRPDPVDTPSSSLTNASMAMPMASRALAEEPQRIAKSRAPLVALVLFLMAAGLGAVWFFAFRSTGPAVDAAPVTTTETTTRVTTTVPALLTPPPPIRPAETASAVTSDAPTATAAPPPHPPSQGRLPAPTATHSAAPVATATAHASSGTGDDLTNPYR